MMPLLHVLAAGAHEIDPPALTRAGRSTTCCHVAVEINKAFGEIRSSRFLCAGWRRCPRFLGLLAVGTFSSGLKPDQVAFP
jgi:hypothetical protein